MMYYDIKKMKKEDRKLLGWLQREKHVAEKKNEVYRAVLLKTLIKSIREYGYFDNTTLLRARWVNRAKGWHEGLRILTELECDIKRFQGEAA